MQFLLRISRWIDRISQWLGWIALGLTLVMTAIGAYNAITRYLGRYIGVNLSSNRYIEVQWYLSSLIFLLGAAYVLRKDAHVRVDIIYSRLSQRQKAWIDLGGALLMLVPFCTIVIIYSMPAVLNSWSVLEQSSDPAGLPRYPLKTMIPIAFAWLGIQGLSEAIKRIAILLGMTPLSDSQEVGS
ncbi:MAG: TRAP transporter small permease subunit [Leptolyngbya sp. SIO1D8]|nr:TRAP transporter small permease subunit [Leptolyngbya sp. SIO1D8]